MTRPLSVAAVRWSAEYLDEWPDDLRVLWLLNVAHMTLGEHPDKALPHRPLTQPKVKR